MKYVNLFIVVSLILLGCSKDDDVRQIICETNYSCSFKVFEKSIIRDSIILLDTRHYDEDTLKFKYVIYDIFKNGNKNVFEYTKSTTPNIVDPHSGTLVFEIDQDAEEFAYSNTDLKEIKTIYQNSCIECFERVSINPERGSIKGRKLNETKWWIEIDLTLKSFNPNDGQDHEYNYKVTEIFTMQ